MSHSITCSVIALGFPSMVHVTLRSLPRVLRVGRSPSQNNTTRPTIGATLRVQSQGRIGFGHGCILDTWQSRRRLVDPRQQGGGASPTVTVASFTTWNERSHVEEVTCLGIRRLEDTRWHRFLELQLTTTTEERTSHSVYQSTHSTLEVEVESGENEGRTSARTEGWWKWLVRVSPMILGITLVVFLFALIFLAILAILLSSEI